MAGVMWDDAADEVRLWNDLGEEEKERLQSKMSDGWNRVRLSKYILFYPWVPFLVRNGPVPPELAPPSAKEREILDHYVMRHDRSRPINNINWKPMMQRLGPSWSRLRVRAYCFARDHPALVNLDTLKTRKQPSARLSGEQQDVSSEEPEPQVKSKAAKA